MNLGTDAFQVAVTVADALNIIYNDKVDDQEKHIVDMCAEKIAQRLHDLDEGFDEEVFLITVRRKSWPLENSPKRLIKVHDEAACAGQRCTIHNRSDHSMRSFTQHWRDDRGIMERICPHGVGHPDPDSPWLPDSYQWVHGCDGCCASTKVINPDPAEGESNE